MNKKILSIFALIMAISILGVSCAKDNSTTNPTTGGSTPPITLEQAKKIVATLTTPVTANSANFNLAAVKDNVKTSGADYTVSVTNSEANKTVEYKDLLTAVKGLETAMNGAENNLITVEDTKITLDMTDGQTTAKATIPYALKSDNKKTGKFIITFVLTGTTSKFAYTEIAGIDTALKALTSLAFNDQSGNNTLSLATGTLSASTFKVADVANTSGANGSLTKIADSLKAETITVTGATVSTDELVFTAKQTSSVNDTATGKIKIIANEGYKLPTALASGEITIEIVLTTANTTWE